MKSVLLLIPTGTEVYEMAAFYDVLGWASRYGTEPIEVVTAGMQGEVRCTFGLRVMADRVISEVNASEFDALALPGGFEEDGYYDDAFGEPLLELIREFERQRKPIASICVGALPIARSGVLHGRCATTYDLSEGKRQKQLAAMGVTVRDEKIVQDGTVLTSTGPATAIDVALRLLEALTDKPNADAIGRLMGFGKG